MNSTQYKNHNKQKYKVILILLFIMVFILLLMVFALIRLQKKESPKELTYDNLQTVKEVVEYYRSRYISEKESEESGYSLDIYVKFGMLLYDQNKNSNEKYYNDLLEDVAKILLYKSFRMIDNEQDIIIKVICKSGKIDSIIINDIEDYFIYMDSQISMGEYKEIGITDFQVTSNIIQTCVDNKWNAMDFGTRDSIFDEYYIYFNRGMKVRTIDNKIYNIVFNKNYKENVINNLFPGVDLEIVETVLGKPTFEDEELGVIGYKGKQIYVFFTKDEISIYRIEESNVDDFFELADYFLDERLDLLEFMNQLTYIWPDYSDYEYTNNTVFISYPLKAVEIKINYDDTNGILLYNNIKNSLSKVQRYLENTNFVARLQIDCVFEAEKRRVKETKQLLEKCNEYKESLDEETKEIIGESLKYNFYAQTDTAKNIYSMKFISVAEGNPNRELNDSIDYYLWLDNDTFLYSKKGKGIYLYKLTDGSVQRLLEGKEDYELKGFRNGILKYDNTQIVLQY